MIGPANAVTKSIELGKELSDAYPCFECWGAGLANPSIFTLLGFGRFRMGRGSSKDVLDGAASSWVISTRDSYAKTSSDWSCISGGRLFQIDDGCHRL